MSRLVINLAIKAAVRPWGAIARRWLGGHWEPWTYEGYTCWFRVFDCRRDGPYPSAPPGVCEDHGSVRRRWRW